MFSLKEIFWHMDYNKTQTLTCLCTFIFGILFSFIVFIAFNRNLPSKSQLSYITDEHFLQIKNDYGFELYDAWISKENNKNNDNELINRRNDEIRNEANEQEAIGSLKLAMEMKAAGKDDKALRLFQHALALAPKNPEVLVKFGEYLEYCKNDILTADQLYYQALTLNPANTEAAINRRRTAQIVEVIDQRRLHVLDQKRDALSAIHESNSALRRAKKEAYFQHIYHSVGIEGNTMTLAQTRSILETRMAIDGKSIDEHNEILGLDLAMKYINDTLVNKNDFITLKDILEIHRRVLGHVDPIEGGEFRRTQVYVGGHIPPGPGDLAILMQRFENWLNSEHALSMHPIKFAALAHYKLVHIHPFTDGNGRTSRLLMNTILMKSGYPPIIIPKQQRHKYYDFLQLANEGDIRPFIRFIADCTEKTLDLYLWATSEFSNQIPRLAQGEFQNSSFELAEELDEALDDISRIELNEDKKSESTNAQTVPVA